MGWKYFDYRCPDCGHEFESMEKDCKDTVTCTAVTREALQGVPEELCGAVVDHQPSANLGWTNDHQTKNDMLRKRSAEHTAKEQKNGNMLSPKDLPKL